MKVENAAEVKSSTIRSIIADLGPKGVMALIAAMALGLILFTDLGGGVMRRSGQIEEAAVDDRTQLVLDIFAPIETAEVHSVILSVESVAQTQSTVFSSRPAAEREIVNGVVIYYEGTLLHPAETRRAISLLLDVGLHQIEFLNRR